MSKWRYALCSVRHAGPPVLKSEWYNSLDQMERHTSFEDREVWSVLRCDDQVRQLGIDNHWVTFQKAEYWLVPMSKGGRLTREINGYWGEIEDAKRSTEDE